MLSLDQVLIYRLSLDSSESLQRCPDLKDFQCPFLQLLEAVKPVFTTCFCILVLAVSCLLLLLNVFHPLGVSCVISFLKQQHFVVPVPSLCSRSCGSAGFSLALALGDLLPLCTHIWVAGSTLEIPFLYGLLQPSPDTPCLNSEGL